MNSDSTFSIAFHNIDEHVWMLNQNATARGGEIIGSKAYPQAWIDYINKTPAMKGIIANRNSDFLKSKYKSKVTSVANRISGISSSQEETILCILEYMRLMVTYEAVAGTSQNSNNQFHNVAHGSKESGLIPAFAGKGICEAQAYYCRDLLLASGINARSIWVGTSTSSHADVLVDDKKILDPTNFDGTIRGIAGGHLYEKFGLQKYDSSRDLTHNKLELAKSKVQHMLIEDLGIGRISGNLGIPNMQGFDKHLAIWMYLGSKLSPSNKPENAYMVNINGNEIELNSAAELFYRANNMHYRIAQTYSTPTQDRFIPLVEIDVNGRKKGLILSHIVYMNNINKFNINTLNLLSKHSNSSYRYDDNNNDIAAMSQSYRKLLPAIEAENMRNEK